MAQFEDLSGKTFGYWTVVKRAENTKNGSAQWLCKCECGAERVIRAQALKNGTTKSCGCHKNDYNRTHGGKGTRLYECWRHMRYRCENPSNQAYEYYGGRGVSVCEEWHDFASFRQWALANGYDDSLTIDRIDVDGNYEPSNCRWAGSKTQMNNRRNTRHYEMDGKSLTLSEWSRLTGIPSTTIYKRMKMGDSFEEAVKKRK